MNYRYDGTPSNYPAQCPGTAGSPPMSARASGDDGVPGWWVFVFVVLVLGTLAGVLLVLNAA